MAQTNVQAFSGDVEISGETVLGTATYRKKIRWDRNELAYVYLGNIRTNNTTGIRLDVSLNNSDSGYEMYQFQITLNGNDDSHAGGKMLYSAQGGTVSVLKEVDIGYVYVGSGGSYEYQLWLKDPTTDTTGQMDVYLNCQGYYNFDTGVSDVAQGGSAPTNFNLGTPGVVVDKFGKVGIGTNEPEHELHVKGSGGVRIGVESTSGYGGLEIGGANGGLIDFKTPFSDDNDVRIIYNGESLNFNGSDVGIGANSPVSGLTVFKDIESSNSFITERVLFRETWPNGLNSLVGDLGTWVVTNLNQQSGPSVEITPDGYGIVAFNGVPADNGEFVSPAFDLSDYALSDGVLPATNKRKTTTRVFLKCYFGTRNLSASGEVAHVQFSPDNGSTWYTVATSQDENNTDRFTMLSADLSPYILETSTNAKIRFYMPWSVAGGDYMRIGRIWIHESDVPTNLGGMWLGAGGNIGIGTTNPQVDLEIENVNGSPELRFTDPFSGSVDGWDARSNVLGEISWYSRDNQLTNSYAKVASITSKHFDDGFPDGALCFTTSSNGVLNEDAMVIDQIGNVGIGSTNPGSLLDLYKDATNGATIRMKSSGNGEITISKKSSSSTDQSLQFTNFPSTGTSPSYQFLSWSGTAWNYPLAMMGDGRLAMNGNSITHPKNGVLTIYSTNVDKLVDQFVFKACIDTNVIGFFLNAAGTARGSINGTNASSIQYATTSDERLKKQIKPMQTTLDRVNALKPCTYTWIRDEAKGYGFIAQEVHKVFPEMKPVVPYSGCTCKCGEKKCESCTLCDDEHDYPKNKDGTDFHYGLDYGQFTPFLTKAIQELDAKVEEHHNRKSLVTGVEYSKIDDYEGLIVSATTNEYRNARPVLTLSNTENDKKCYGVILGKSNSIDNKTNIQKSGDGRMWVVNTDGNLESGDLVTTSVINGYGKKQDDDILRSYTLAKLTQDCDFTERYTPIKRVKQELKDVTYYLQENYVQVADLRTVDKEDIIEREVIRYIKIVKESEDFDGKIITPEISEEKYDALTEEEKKSYTVLHFKSITQYEYDRIPDSEKVNYQETIKKINFTREVYESIKPMPECCGEYTTEVRQELVNVLDDNGQLVWEDSEEMEPVYKIRYLDADGNITDEANHVYKAAFVGCTYHCG